MLQASAKDYMTFEARVGYLPAPLAGFVAAPPHIGFVGFPLFVLPPFADAAPIAGCVAASVLLLPQFAAASHAGFVVAPPPVGFVAAPFFVLHQFAGAAATVVFLAVAVLLLPRFVAAPLAGFVVAHVFLLPQFTGHAPLAGFNTAPAPVPVACHEWPLGFFASALIQRFFV